jgi:hypothetical protein
MKKVIAEAESTTFDNSLDVEDKEREKADDSDF